MNAKWYVIVFFLSLIFTKQANSQYLSVKGFFELNQQLGCHDLTVNITSLVPDVITFQYDGSTSPINDNPFFTYTEAGTYWINQYHQGPGGDERKDSIMVIVVLPELPDIELLSCNNLELIVAIKDNYYDEYEINYGDGTIIIIPAGNTILPYTYLTNAATNVAVTGLFTTATNRCGVTSIPFDPIATVLPAQIDSLIALDDKTIKLDYVLPVNSVNKLEISLGDNSNFVLFKNLQQNTTTDTLFNLPITQNTYCFRISTYDACSNFRSYSNQICSINLNASAQNNQIALDWATFDFGSSQTTDLIREGSLLTTTTFPLIQYLDSTVVCNITYCYQAEVYYSGGVSRSLEVCSTAFSTDIPPTIENISSITNSDSINWLWGIPQNTTPAYYYVQHTLVDGSLIGNKDSVGINSYINNFEQAAKYIAVQIVDICDNISPFNIIGSSIYLQGDINNNSDIELYWNDYFGWVDGFLDYYITLKDSEGNLIDSLSTAGSLTFNLPLANQVNQSITFTVWAIPVLNGVSTSRSNIITIERDPVIGIPNSFTPNGDGLNDKFIISGKFIASYEMQIFNRWGEVLFQTTDLENGWDGILKEEKITTGNYAYWIRVKDLNNKEHIRTGSILILSN